MQLISSFITCCYNHLPRNSFFLEPKTLGIVSSQHHHLLIQNSSAKNIFALAQLMKWIEAS